MTELNPQVKQIRVPLSVWTLAHYVLRAGRDTFTYTEVKNAACGSPETALVMGLIMKLNNGLYKANMELAKLYASLLPKAYVPDRKGRWGSPLASSGEKSSCEAREEALRLAWAWSKLAKWAEAHAEDAEDPPKKVLEVLERHGIEVQRMVLPSGAKAVVAKVLNMYIIMDLLMTKNSPKCLRFPQLGPDAMLCASTREKLLWHLVPLTLRPQN
jgi:hypothetical protein